MKKIFVAALIIIMFSSSLFAELIYMKDGSMIDAAIVERGSTELTLNDGQRTFRVPLSKIKNISKKHPQETAAGQPQQKPADTTVAEDIKRGSQFKTGPRRRRTENSRV